jgi:hypothetical protein
MSNIRIVLFTIMSLVVGFVDAGDQWAGISCKKNEITINRTINGKIVSTVLTYNSDDTVGTLIQKYKKEFNIADTDNVDFLCLYNILDESVGAEELSRFTSLGARIRKW